MTVPPNFSKYGSANGAGPGWQQPPGAGGRTRYTTNSKTRNYNFNVGGGSGGNGQGRGRGPAGVGGRDRSYSPLADPEFFTNADIRNYCDTARAGFLQLSFELSMAAEVLQAVLKEVPDPEGRAFGSLTRARRVAKHLKKAADDAKDAAKNSARTYAAFQREYSPELDTHAYRRPRQPRRRFDFGV